MRKSFGYSILALAALVLGCGENDPSTVTDGSAADSCGVAGKSVACVGPGGCEGGQVCRADGTFASCECDAPVNDECGAVGVVVTCVGQGNCIGAQACQDNGRYTQCQCLPPVPVPDAGEPDLAVTIASPKANAVLRGEVVVKGTAGEDALAVGVSIAGRPFVTATGTAKWSASIDTTGLEDGPATLVVSARSATGIENVVTRTVRIVNRDLVIGHWARRSGSACDLYLFESGAYYTSCPLGGYGSGDWQRETRKLISLQGNFGAIYVYLATLSNGGERLEITPYAPSGSTTYSFKLIDDLRGGGEDIDAGVDDDAGTP